ncbi:MAG TPA: FAD-dependent thymidylate synthase [Chthonomonas sp.]|uniref:FAD-dependent thymidylate synthase n=1 Tax=Chthonomonas sp. TaxID=2282153 RepID=UPI002B4B1A83|nr:FAD-dependent thymidylate synthase [Chthonomonas sp.]HLI49547.1 FAD-dependent thymidylate synthase [Chthonomonas sp.]
MLAEGHTDWREIPISGTEKGFPAIHSQVCHTVKGTPYLCHPGVILIGRTQTEIGELATFLEGFDPDLGFATYLQDPVPLDPGTQLCKTAGQLCYASFGPKRTWNREAKRYFDNIKESGHGSVLEHANFSLLCYGISRSVTHELVRHRHFSYSQISQRYVSGRVLRFVERPEYQQNPTLHAEFLERIDRAAADYERTVERLLEAQQAGQPLLSAEMRTDLRKKVQQTARSLLPNETEAPLVVTGNARAWRHFLEMRASFHAEIEIRALAFLAYRCLVAVEPILFEDYQVVAFPDGTFGLDTAFRKV